MAGKLVLCRHGQSEWNLKNLFTGWKDVDLTQQGNDEAIAAGKPFRKDQRWVPLGRISPHLVDAVVVSEDASFWDHSGFDVNEIRESIKKNLDLALNDKNGGGSAA